MSRASMATAARRKALGWPLLRPWRRTVREPYTWQIGGITAFGGSTWPEESQRSRARARLVTPAMVGRRPRRGCLNRLGLRWTARGTSTWPTGGITASAGSTQPALSRHTPGRGRKDRTGTAGQQPRLSCRIRLLSRWTGREAYTWPTWATAVYGESTLPESFRHTPGRESRVRTGMTGRRPRRGSRIRPEWLWTRPETSTWRTC